jgi:hypothetical protein
MKKMKFLALIWVLNLFSVQAQEKWQTSAQLDFIFPSNKEYSYNDSNNVFTDVELDNSGFLLSSFAVQGDYNYFILKKLSIGVVGGFQTLSKPSYSFLKVGGVMRYFFTDKNSGFLYINATNDFSLNKDKFKTGATARAGVGFPILQKDEYQLILNLFGEYTQLQLDGGKPLLGLPDETPKYYATRSLGLSVGIVF